MSDLATFGAVQELDTAIALATSTDWTITYENARFFQLFPPDGSEIDTLVSRLPGFRAERAADRVASRRDLEFETETRSEPRPTPVRVRVHPLTDTDFVVVEVWDVSREKEARYMLDSYSGLAERNARDLEKEKERVERLLLNIMPRSVLEEMKEYGTNTPQRFDAASILMLDFVGFTDMAISQDPGTIITELNDIFSAFDRIVDMLNAERLKTIGDAYIAVAGVPESNPDHAHSIARAALRIRRYLERRNAAHPQSWIARIGINTGPVIGSLVGIQKYVYDLFGPGVNLAARMENLSEPMRITCSQNTYEILKDDFIFVDRGTYDVKGFGMQPLYFLEGEVGRGPH